MYLHMYLYIYIYMYMPLPKSTFHNCFLWTAVESVPRETLRKQGVCRSKTPASFSGRSLQSAVVAPLPYPYDHCTVR